MLFKFLCLTFNSVDKNLICDQAFKLTLFSVLFYVVFIMLYKLGQTFDAVDEDPNL